MKLLSKMGKGVAGFFTNNEQGSVLWLLEQFVTGLINLFKLGGQFLAEFVAVQKEKQKEEELDERK